MAAGVLDLAPPVPPARRLAVLARLVLAMHGANGAPTEADRAWALAEELASLLDEAAPPKSTSARRCRVLPARISPRTGI